MILAGPFSIANALAHSFPQRWERSYWALLLAAALLACAPTASPRDGAGTQPEDRPGAAGQGRTLTILLRVEPVGAIDGADDRGTIHKALFSATLGGWDEQGKPYPMLA